MRMTALIAAFTLASVAAHAEPRSLSLSGVDQKLPSSLGKAADAPKLVEAPKPPDPPAVPVPPPAVAAPAAAPAPAAPAAAPAVEAPKAAETPTYVPRPSVAAPKPAESREGQVTFDEAKPVAPVAAVTDEKPKQAKADKPKRKRQHWDEARIMREISRYSGYAGMLGGW